MHATALSLPRLGPGPGLLRTVSGLEDLTAFPYPPGPGGVMFSGLYHPLALPAHPLGALGALGALGDWGLPLHPLPLTSTPPPLDLSLKSGPPSTPITPPSTPSPASPSRKRPHLEEAQNKVTPAKEDLCNNNDESATNHNTSASAISVDLLCSASKRPQAKVPAKRTKAVRKLNFDEDKSSPVSGTIIRDLCEVEADSLIVRKGDIDPAFNVVEVTEEAKAELASIENKIGDYVCRLCRELFEDAFSLAQHRCSCIVHVEYRCPECDKVFNCPANLASHRRWHKPKAPPVEVKKDDDNSNCSEPGLDVGQIPCPICNKRFRRQAYLRKHLSTHQMPTTSTFPIAVPPIHTDLPAAD